MAQDIQAEYYEDEGFWAKGALEDPGNRKRIEATIELISTQATSLLDVGCGNGVFGNLLLDKRPDVAVTGADRSEVAMKFAHFPVQNASIDALPFKNESFDVVSCLQVLEHLPNTIYTTALSELARVSRSQLIIGVPFEESLERDLTQCPQCKTSFNFNLHVRSYSLPGLETLFSAYGFELVSHVFPVAKKRKKYVNELLTALKGRPKNIPTFMSPICPICAYRNPVQYDFAPRPEEAVRPRSVGFSRRMGKSILEGATALLPSETVKGYWIVALYERRVCLSDAQG